MGLHHPELRGQGHPQPTQLPATGERVLATAQRGSPTRNISLADTFITETHLQNTGWCTALLFTAQLDITCSPRGCHLESGKPIYFRLRISLVVLVRCRKPINHQRSLGVSISQEACHLLAQRQTGSRHTIHSSANILCPLAWSICHLCILP